MKESYIEIIARCDGPKSKRKRGHRAKINLVYRDLETANENERYN